MSGGSITLSAPTEGQYQGVLFYQDRHISGGTASDFEGGSSMLLAGRL